MGDRLWLLLVVLLVLGAAALTWHKLSTPPAPPEAGIQAAADLHAETTGREDDPWARPASLTRPPSGMVYILLMLHRP